MPLITQELRNEKIATKESTLLHQSVHMLTEESSTARMNSKSSVGDAFHSDDMRQACGKELGMLPYVGDSFPDEICYLNSAGSLLVHFPVYMRGAHYSSSSRCVAYKTRGPLR